MKDIYFTKFAISPQYSLDSNKDFSKTSDDPEDPRDFKPEEESPDFC